MFVKGKRRNLLSLIFYINVIFIMAIIDDIYQQFKDYFGDDKVDLQHYENNLIKIDSYGSSSCQPGDYMIVVHWPVVTVTNEYDNSIDIWDLYSATVIGPNGKLRLAPQFSRSTYDKLQWSSDYMHSHVSSIGKSDLSRFHASCLGSGPINETIRKLKTDQYTDLDIWNLYCWELDKYVAVESITGVPYKRMQNLGNTSDSTGSSSEFRIQPNCPVSSVIDRRIVRELIVALINNKVLKFAYFDGKYSIASTYVDTVLDISNCFIELYNNDAALRKLKSKEKLFESSFIRKMFIKDGIIYGQDEGSNIPIEAAIGTIMFNFKGEPVKLQLKDFHQDYSSNEVYLLNTDIINYVVYLILKHVNLEYGKTTNTGTTGKNARII